MRTQIKRTILTLYIGFLCLLPTAFTQNDTLINAIKAKKFEVAEQLILDGANIHAVDTNGANTILWACFRGQFKLVKLLAEKGVELYPEGVIYSKSKSTTWGNLLAAAIVSNNLDIIKYLIEEHQFPVDDREYSPRTGKRVGWTALKWATYFHNRSSTHYNRDAIIEYLLAQGADKQLTRLEVGIYYSGKEKYLEARNLLEQEYATATIDTLHYITSFKLLYYLAATHRLMGAYNKAIPLYLELIEQAEKIGKTKSAYYIYSFNRLGGTYHQIGDYEKSQLYYEEAGNRLKVMFGETDRDYVINANSLAMLYQEQGKHEAALEILYTSLPIIKQGVMDKSTDSIHYFRCLLDIAKDAKYQRDSLHALARLEEAATFFKSSKEAQRDYAITLKEMGQLYATRNQYATAKTYYDQALIITDQLYKPSHQFNREWTAQLANIEEQLGSLAVSSEKLLYANEQTKIYIQNLFAQFSEREQLAMSEKEISHFDQLKSYHYRNEQFSAEVFDNELFLRGLLLKNNQELLRQLRDSEDETILANYEKWVTLQKLITRQLTLPIEETLPNLEALQLEAEALESDLARKSTLFSEQQTSPTWLQLKDQLKEGEAVLQITHFNYHEPSRMTDSVFYIAQIIQSNLEAPVSVFLCEEQQLKKSLKYPTIKATQKEGEDLYVSRGIVPNKKKKQKGLQFIWKQLLPYLENTHTLYLSNSGIFNELNIGAIPVEKDVLAIDRFQIHQYSNLSTLLKKRNRTTPNNDYLLIGGVDYKSTLPNSTTTSKGWDFLKGTQTEVKAIQEMVQKAAAKVVVLEQQQASEDTLKTLLTSSPSPKCIHFATHGFFFPQVLRDSSITESRLPYATSTDPMIRSGLVLASANYAWSGQLVPANQEDGILTAKEVAALHLEQTELVVLSACQTGLGDIRGQEGVYGLQRAFKQAGVRYLMMSLWEVPDKETARFMKTFYHHYLEQQLPIRKAFTTTQQTMRMRYNNPYLWAGFVLVE